jgi:glycosyltransferase involved in cell wall biosynthesis
MQNKLTIGIIGSRGIPNRYGGFEAFAAQISPRLTEKGHRVMVYCSHDQPYREKFLENVELVFRYNPESWMGTAGQFFYDLNCNLHSLHQPFDVMLHLGYTSDSIWSALWNRKCRHITNMDGMEWMRSKYTPLVQSFLKIAERRAASRSDLLIADSKGIQEYLGSHYPTPVRYISYGAVMPSSFPVEALEQFQVEPYQYDLLIARMEPENNIELAIEAKRMEQSTIPMLIFSNETSYGNELKQRYQHERIIRFQPAIYQEEVLHSLRHYSRYYLHGHSVGGTNPSLLEAMASGCRIVAHDNVFNRSVLEGNAGFYKDAQQLAGLLTQSWSLEKFHEQTENNMGLIKNNHNWDFITDEYENAFYQVLEK